MILSGCFNVKRSDSNTKVRERHFRGPNLLGNAVSLWFAHGQRLLKALCPTEMSTKGSSEASTHWAMPSHARLPMGKGRLSLLAQRKRAPAALQKPHLTGQCRLMSVCPWANAALAALPMEDGLPSVTSARRSQHESQQASARTGPGL